jgi:hypothetical protein
LLAHEVVVFVLWVKKKVASKKAKA